MIRLVVYTLVLGCGAHLATDTNKVWGYLWGRETPPLFFYTYPVLHHEKTREQRKAKTTKLVG